MAKAKPAAKDGYQPQCAALTADGAQCRNSARGASRYCASHKGYQPPATKGLAKRIEGQSWSATDDQTDAQSRREADTRPAVGGAKDTRLAVRRKGKAAKAAKATPAPARPKAARRAPARRRDLVSPPTMTETPNEDGSGYVANILQEERDYLVVYEEPDPDGLPTDDGLVLDVDAGQPVSLGEVNLEQKLDLELSNNTNWVGRLGFVLSIVGAFIALVACGTFAYAYPDPWYTPSGELSSTSLIPTTLLLGVAGALSMLAGVILTHYGRRIQARGNLSRMRIVEKAFQPRVALGDET